MGFLDWLLGRETTMQTVVSTQPHLFEVDVPYEVFGIQTSTDPVSQVGKVSRNIARQVPAIKRARDLICGTLGGIPLEMVDSDNEYQVNQLLEQPEDDVPRSVTWTRLYEDLFYDGIAWFKVISTDYRGYPVTVKRIDPCKVTVREGQVYVDSKAVRHDQVIRFDSPNGGILADGARAIKTLIRLEAAAGKYAEDPMPQGYFAPTEGADPIDDEEIAALLTAWKNARQVGATGYVPAALKYDTVAFSPEQLQMTDARQHAVLEIARLTGIDAEDLSVSTTSRTYFNGQDRRMQRISDVLGPYAMAVTDRLRMRDITPRGYDVRADFSGFLRADDNTRLNNYIKAHALGLYTLEQIADREGLPAPETQAITQAREEVIREATQIAEETA